MVRRWSRLDYIEVEQTYREFPSFVRLRFTRNRIHIARRHLFLKKKWRRSYLRLARALRYRPIYIPVASWLRMVSRLAGSYRSLFALQGSTRIWNLEGSVEETFDTRGDLITAWGTMQRPPRHPKYVYLPLLMRSLLPGKLWSYASAGYISEPVVPTQLQIGMDFFTNFYKITLSLVILCRKLITLSTLWSISLDKRNLLWSRRDLKLSKNVFFEQGPDLIEFYVPIDFDQMHLNPYESEITNR